MFSDLRKFVDEMNATNSSNDKVEIIKRYPQLENLLHYVYSPFTKFYITPKLLDKYPDMIADFIMIGDPTVDESIFNMLDCLAYRTTTGHDAVKMVNKFISFHKEYEDLIRLIIGKDLKTRAGASLINKAFGREVVPGFDVALAGKYEDNIKKIKFSDDWYYSRKLDGVRVLAFVDKLGQTTFLSRAGNEFTTLSKVAEAIETAGIKDIILDGEMCIVDNNGIEDFNTVVGDIKRKNYTIQNPKFIIFDVLTHSEFTNKEGKTKLMDRLERLELFQLPQNGILSKIEFTRVTSHEQIKALSEKAAADGWEGIMLRKNTGYKGIRNSDLLKVKIFHDDEYKIVSIDTGKFRVIENGLEVEIDCMTAAGIIHKGTKVGVGSGWSLDQRKHYYAHPEELIGKEATVQYFSESVTDGGISLRFPTIKKVWEDGKRDI